MRRTPHHNHLYCITCSRTIEFKNDEIVRRQEVVRAEEVPIQSRLSQPQDLRLLRSMSPQPQIDTMACGEHRTVPDLEAFWAKIATELNCLDRHLLGTGKNEPALIWIGDPGDQRILTYQALHREVCRFANALWSLDVRGGDRVVLYMPALPELAIAMLACARICAAHSVVSAEAGAEPLRDRIREAPIDQNPAA